MFTYLQNLYYTLTENEQALFVLKYKKIADLSQKLYETRCKHISCGRTEGYSRQIENLRMQIDALIDQVNMQFEQMKLTDAQLSDIDFYNDTTRFWAKQSKALADLQKPVYLNDQPV